MSSVSSKAITLDTLIERAIAETAERRADGRPMTATYRIDHSDGEQYAITVDPIASLNDILEGRKSIQ